MGPTLKQIELYKQLREITRQHHMYSDQIMAIAVWIDKEFGLKKERCSEFSPKRVESLNFEVRPDIETFNLMLECLEEAIETLMLETSKKNDKWMNVRRMALYAKGDYKASDSEK